MLFEETDTDESGNSQSDVSSLDNDVSRTQFESKSTEEVTDDGDDDLDSQVWNKIELESDIEFSEDYGMMEELSTKSEDDIRVCPWEVASQSGSEKIFVF